MNRPSEWEFQRVNPREIRRDPFEAEFFTGESEDDAASGRTDALVREVIQNSLDAGSGSGPVRVRFGLDYEGQRLPPERATPYMRGLVEHLDALGNNEVNLETGIPDMTYLLIEDFGTRGLRGDPERHSDPPGDASQPESFYWFWRNIGRSGKTGTDRGRWGLGKTVYPSASFINSFFGLTVRGGDDRRMLMGQAITKIHSSDGEEYQAEGFFRDPERSADLQMPFEDEDLLARFETDFGLRRGQEPGLSVVVPYPADRIETDDLTRSVIIHFFLPVLREELVVEVIGAGGTCITIDATSIQEQARQLGWDGERRRKCHAPPPFGLAIGAIEHQLRENLFTLKLAGESSVPSWGEHLFHPGQMAEMRERFETSGSLAARVPMTVELRDGSKVETFFDVFLERDPDQARADDYYVREGMTISGIDELGGKRAFRGLLVVDDSTLSTLLGDTEGPAHTGWGTGESRPDARYSKWKRRVTFVRKALGKLHQLVSPPPASLSPDWLLDIFAVEDPQQEGTRKRRKKKRVKPDEPPPPPPPPRQRPFELERLEGGIRLRGIPGVSAAGNRIRVAAAYDVPSGDPFRHYSPFDFRFEAGGGIRIETTGAEVESASGNTLELLVDSPFFDVNIDGFDPLVDLCVRANLLEGEL